MAHTQKLGTFRPNDRLKWFFGSLLNGRSLEDWSEMFGCSFLKWVFLGNWVGWVGGYKGNEQNCRLKN